VGYYFFDPPAETPLYSFNVAQGIPTDAYGNVFCDAQNDAYLDTKGRLHTFYWLRDESTGGDTRNRHAVISEGEILYDEEFSLNVGSYAALIQDTQERFYIIGSNGVVAQASNEEGTEFQQPISLDFQGYNVDYSGISLAAPRCGVPLNSFVDGVYPSDGNTYVYFRLRLTDDEPVTDIHQERALQLTLKRHPATPRLMLFNHSLWVTCNGALYSVRGEKSIHKQFLIRTDEK
jgi:hypothetical protein